MSIPTWDSLQLVSEPTILGREYATMFNSGCYYQPQQVSADIHFHGFNPNPYGYEYYHGHFHSHSSQVCTYPVDNSNPGFYFVQFVDGAVVSMTAEGLDNLLKSSYGISETQSIHFPSMVGLFDSASSKTLAPKSENTSLTMISLPPRRSKLKRGAIGSKRKAWTKKRKYELGRQLTTAKLSSKQIVRRVRTRGSSGELETNLSIGNKIQKEDQSWIVEGNGDVADHVFDKISLKDESKVTDKQGKHSVEKELLEIKEVIAANSCHECLDISEDQMFEECMLKSNSGLIAALQWIETETEIEEEGKYVENQLFDKSPQRDMDVSYEVLVPDCDIWNDNSVLNDNSEWERVYKLICSDYEASSLPIKFLYEENSMVNITEVSSYEEERPSSGVAENISEAATLEALPGAMISIPKIGVDFTSSHEVCVPKTLNFDATYANIAEVFIIDSNLRADLEKNGVDKVETKLFVCPSPPVLYVHEVFDKMPTCVAMGPFDKLAIVSEIEKPIASPLNNHELELQSGCGDNAYCPNTVLDLFTRITTELFVKDLIIIVYVNNEANLATASDGNISAARSVVTNRNSKEAKIAMAIVSPVKIVDHVKGYEGNMLVLNVSKINCNHITRALGPVIYQGRFIGELARKICVEGDGINLGGHAFDASIQEIRERVFELLSLGDADFDKRLDELLAANFKRDEEMSNGTKHKKTPVKLDKFEQTCSHLYDKSKTHVQIVFHLPALYLDICLEKCIWAAGQTCNVSIATYKLGLRFIAVGHLTNIIISGLSHVKGGVKHDECFCASRIIYAIVGVVPLVGIGGAIVLDKYEIKEVKIIRELFFWGLQHRFKWLKLDHGHMEGTQTLSVRGKSISYQFWKKAALNGSFLISLVMREDHKYFCEQRASQPLLDRKCNVTGAIGYTSQEIALGLGLDKTSKERDILIFDPGG